MTITDTLKYFFIGLVALILIAVASAFVMPELSSTAFDDLFSSLIGPLARFWWLWLFFLLLYVVKSSWLSYVQARFRSEIQWSMLEIHIPRELRKTPRAMEQVFTAIHQLRNAPAHVGERWLDGEVTRWFSFEVASFGGEIHFYARVPTIHRNTIEAALYANYPDLEVTEVEDYTRRLPATYAELAREKYQIFGNELALAKPDGYPIRTYFDFEAVEETKELDPIASLMEVMGKLKPAETIWVQIIIRPADDSWKKEAEQLVKKLKDELGRDEQEGQFGKFIFKDRSPGETDLLKAIERNISKPGFETLIRYLYIAPESIYKGDFGRYAVFAAFNQYATESMNKFRNNFRNWTRASIWYFPHFFPDRRKWARRMRIYENYRKRYIYEETSNAGFFTRLSKIRRHHIAFEVKSDKFVLNTEELATIFHPPTFLVLTAPFIRRIESKRGGVPAGLAVYGGDEDELPGMKK